MTVSSHWNSRLAEPAPPLAENRWENWLWNFPFGFYVIPRVLETCNARKGIFSICQEFFVVRVIMMEHSPLAYHLFIQMLQYFVMCLLLWRTATRVIFPSLHQLRFFVWIPFQRVMCNYSLFWLFNTVRVLRSDNTSPISSSLSNWLLFPELMVRAAHRTQKKSEAHFYAVTHLRHAYAFASTFDPINILSEIVNNTRRRKKTDAGVDLNFNSSSTYLLLLFGNWFQVGLSLLVE